MNLTPLQAEKFARKLISDLVPGSAPLQTLPENDPILIGGGQARVFRNCGFGTDLRGAVTKGRVREAALILAREIKRRGVNRWTLEFRRTFDPLRKRTLTRLEILINRPV